MTKQMDHQYLAHNIFTGFQPNGVKFSCLHVQDGGMWSHIQVVDY